nr:MAG TPA: hypothetical protein [Bacteriophage sp.]
MTFPAQRGNLFSSDAGGACIWCGTIQPPWIEKVRRTSPSNAGRAPVTGAFPFFTFCL